MAGCSSRCWAGGCGHFRQSEPCVDHRRDQVVQGASGYRYANSDMEDLEAQLKAGRADGARFILIATDGVFSMDGYLAKLGEIRALADRYGAHGDGG